MSFPDDVTTRNLTSGFPFGLVGSDDDLVIELQLTPSRSMVWAATGSVAVGRKITARSQPGQQLVVPVAVTDQAGWLDGAGNAISAASGAQTHSYGAKVYIKSGSSVVAEFPTKNIVVPTGDGSDLDLDLMLPLTTVGGVTVAIPDIWSEQLAAAEAAAEAAQAAASNPDVEGALEQVSWGGALSGQGSDPGFNSSALSNAMAARVNDPTSSVAAALAGAFLQVWRPDTIYAAGQRLLNPAGQIVTVNTGHTSGATYDATKYTAVSAAGGGLSLVDNLDGTATLTATGSSTITDNGDGTASIAA